MTTWSAVTWDTARAGGFAAYVLLTLAVAIGLILRSRLSSERWPRVITYELHGYVSLLALVFLTLHVLAVAVDPFTHFGLGELIVPFASHYRPLWMGLGIVALYLLLAVWVTTFLRKRIGHQAWRRVHGLAFAVYAAATVHGLGAGSDTRTSWGTAVYVVSVLLVVGLSTRRLLVPAGSDRRSRPGPGGCDRGRRGRRRGLGPRGSLRRWLGEARPYGADRGRRQARRESHGHPGAPAFADRPPAFPRAFRRAGARRTGERDGADHGSH